MHNLFPVTYVSCLGLRLFYIIHIPYFISLFQYDKIITALGVASKYHYACAKMYSNFIEITYVSAYT